MNPIKTLVLALALCTTFITTFSGVASANAQYGNISNIYYNNCTTAPVGYIATVNWTFAKPYGHTTTFKVAVSNGFSTNTTNKSATVRAENGNMITVKAYVDGGLADTRSVTFYRNYCR